MTDFIKYLFYNNGEPLLFTHLFFWIFLLIVFLIYSFIYKKQKLKILYLLLVSFYFYYKTSGVFILLLWFTIISDFFWAKQISQTQNTLYKKLFLSISVILNLLLLSYFKYSVFIIDSINNLIGGTLHFTNYFSMFTNSFFSTNFDVDKLIFPVGISFFTFQTLSYVVDVYRNKVETLKSVTDYGFYVCFFPHLVAGPIVKAHDFIYQIYQPYQLSVLEFKQAWLLIIKGLSKKIVADFIALQMVDKIFDNPNYFTAFENFLAIIGYSYQVYADFSGYTDIAIGIALLFGYRLKINFNYPYKAQSPSEFWKRWHISLSSWLKEYLYIPLGGNRNTTITSYILICFVSVVMLLLFGNLLILYFIFGLITILFLLAFISKKFRQIINTDINIMVTMLLGGLWHGSSWLFVIWGGLNGIAVVVHKQWEKISPFKTTRNKYIQFALILGTLLFISFTRIFFRSQTLEGAGKMLNKLFSMWEWYFIPEIVLHYKDVLFLLLIGYIIHWLPEKARQYVYNKVYNIPLYALIPMTCCIILLLYQLMSSESKPFIYFQF